LLELYGLSAGVDDKRFYSLGEDVAKDMQLLDQEVLTSRAPTPCSSRMEPLPTARVQLRQDGKAAQLNEYRVQQQVRTRLLAHVPLACSNIITSAWRAPRSSAGSISASGATTRPSRSCAAILQTAPPPTQRTT
jgi:hypothetical protein